MVKNWIISITFIVVMASVCIAGCTTISSSPDGTTDSKIPLVSVDKPSVTSTTKVPTARVSPLKLTINSIYDYTSDNQFSQPRNGYEFIIVDFSITNNGLPDGYSYSPYDVKVQDPDNYQYGYDSCSYSVPGCFEGTTISLGETRRGKLVFEVPVAPEGTTYKVILNP